jgi:ATP-binding cassette subfamily C exporter for protease/lipase
MSGLPRRIGWGFAGVGLFSLLINALMLGPSLYMLQVYDRVMPGQNQLTLLVSSAALLLVLALVCFLEIGRSRLLVRLGMELDRSLAPRVMEASMDAQLPALQRNPTQVFADLTVVRQFLTGNGVFALFDAPWFFIYIGVLFVLHPWLGWLGLAFALILLAIALGSRVWTAAPAQAATDAALAVSAEQQSLLRMAPVIHVMGMLLPMRAAWTQRFAGQSQAQERAESREHGATAVSKFFRYTQQSLSLAAGALLVIRGEISPGAMIVASLLMSRALAPLDLLVGTWRPLLQAQSAWARIQALLRTNPPQPPGTLVQDPQGRIELRGLSVQVPGKAEPILRDVNLDIPAGSMVCVLGPSGSGKSTLVRAMLGLWPGHGGQVLLDGAALSRWQPQALGPCVGYLPQELDFLEGSVAQNISRFGALDAQQVVAAAQAAAVHDVVLRLPQGYQTPLGEFGVRLSAGQKQRIGLARALYGGPRLVVLDEPDANLDEAGDQALRQAIAGLRAGGVTVVLVTHRAALVQTADLVLQMRQGQVAQLGPPAQVLAAQQPAPAVSVIQGTPT